MNACLSRTLWRSTRWPFLKYLALLTRASVLPSIDGSRPASQRYTEEFKIEAVKRVVNRGHRVADVAIRLGISSHSLYQWIKLHSKPAETRQGDASRFVYRGLAVL